LGLLELRDGVPGLALQDNLDWLTDHQGEFTLQCYAVVVMSENHQNRPVKGCSIGRTGQVTSSDGAEGTTSLRA